MREIKFKVINESGLVAENVTLENAHYYVFDGDNITEQGSNVFVQYTGLKDVNGRDVYEGDCFIKLVSYINFEEETTTFGKELCVVKFHEGKFMVYQDGWGYFELLDVIKQKHDGYDRWESGEVDGNIYENPELLKTTYSTF